MNRTKKSSKILSCLITAGLLIVICGACRSKNAGDKSGAGPADGPGKSTVKVVKLQPLKMAEKLAYTGKLEANQEMNITTEVSGKIARIYVEEGDRVAKGQLLAELDTESTRLQLRQAEAGLAAAEANAKDALKNKERMDRLIKENAVSKTQQEKVELAYEAAAAGLEQAKAAVALARHALDLSIMKAPFSGIVAARNAEVGDVVNSMMTGGPGILKIVDYLKIKMAVGMTQSDVVRVAKGNDVILRTDAYPGREFTGRVSVVNLSADSDSGKFRVEAVFDNPRLELRAGTFAEVVFEVGARMNALAVPQRSIMEGGSVFVAEGGKAYRRNVILGIQNAELVEITAGLKEGDLVIVEGVIGLEDGSPIEIK